MLNNLMKNKIFQNNKYSSQLGPKKDQMITNEYINNTYKSNQSLDQLTSKSDNFKNYAKSNSIQIEKLLQELFTILKMRITLETCIHPQESEIKSWIRNNLLLIDLKHFDIKNMNVLVDDLMEIIKDQIKEKDLEDLYLGRNIKLNFFENNVIDYMKPIYRPKAISEEAKDVIDPFQNCKIII